MARKPGEPPVNAKLTLQFGVVVLVIALSLRTYLEWTTWRMTRKQSTGKGLADALPIKQNPEGDYTFVKIVTRGVNVSNAYFEVEEMATRNSSGFLYGKAGSPPPHSLIAQNRTFTVLEGVFDYLLHDKELSAQAGETVFIPQGKTFTWWVGESPQERTVVRIKTEPAGKYAEGVYESLSGFTRDYGSLATTPYLQTIIWAARQKMEFSFIAPSLRLIYRYVMAPIANIINYEATYPKYSSL